MKTIQFIRRKVSLSVVLIGFLAVLLPVLALLQYRWIGQVSASERERLEGNLDTALRRFSEDFFREFSRVAVSFQLRTGAGLELESQLARNHEQWRATSPHPGLVARVLLVDAGGGETGLRQFNETSGGFESATWPHGLEGFRNRLERGFTSPAGQSHPQADLDGPAGGGIWLLMPLLAGGGPRPGPQAVVARLPGWALVEIDTAYLQSDLVPRTVAAHFDLRDYQVAVFREGDPVRVLYASADTPGAAEMAEPDARIEMFAPPGGRPGPSGPGRIARGPRRRGIDEQFFQGRGGGFGPGSPPFLLLGGPWELTARHRSGSLETAVAALRRWNMGIGFGILSLLGVSGAMIVVWAERLRAMGRLQMEFAAGISHELRTPLAVIRTAAHNISSGVVERPEEVREYAAMVQAEGRRLSTMVERIIQFAKTESGRSHYEIQPVDVAPVIEKALDTAFATREEARARAGVRVGSDVPPVLADPVALAHALDNLIANAVKYGSPSKPITIEASYDARDRLVRLAVHDRGTGIGTADLPHLFEPFYRGESARDIPGSGLGLNMVRRMMEGQNGRVTVSNRAGGGATFTLHIPAAR